MSFAFPELLAPSRSNAATQTELLLEHVTIQASDFGMYEGIFREVESDSKKADDLLCLVAELQEEVANQAEFQNVPERDWSMELYSAISDAWKTTQHGHYGKRSGTALCQEKGSSTRGQERWKKATAQGRKGKLSSPSKILLQSRSEALSTSDKAHEVEEEPMQEFLPRSERPTPYNKTCNKPAPRRNNSEFLSLVIFSCVGQKCPFADRTLFSGRFAVFLGHKLGVLSQD